MTNISETESFARANFPLQAGFDPAVVKAFKSAYRKLSARLNIEKGKQILDLGCGRGLVIEALHDISGWLTGFDFSHEFLTCAKKRNSSVKFIQGDMEAIPLLDEKFDVILAITSIEFTKNREKTLAEINRVLKKNGLCYFEFRNEDFFLPRLLSNFIREFLVKFGVLAPIKQKDFTDLKYSEWKNLIQKAGFYILSEFPSLRPWNYGNLLTKLKNLCIEICKYILPLSKQYMVSFSCEKRA
ncbi:MAG: hypothetical protein A3G33_01145 [Omnitrophica bacterium RIFCSPLOWO2_12_FULL_44_17]|uniref:Methyltransferase type 11 domain-containing protein n=1 Tax=Candidatus Danuiimicrobium aquiferis TaxID=1801832 RepID=A0A1G1L0Y6_9BACT|nr:MAG: hypothetical protein A3B72_02460 [Omnitrophica bacterium RIFCSPHIGHO2_02_FULL_45_28]OGW98795.1 MAG: hypothetical protein A3G33_01145 [Omnitrophica bacterium RIFCSPLOWO2_12_FULL_44_17]OGX02501.1 MAG: hypothetical protein A3J12_00255 [Omnitrophica bacterium RIFCSPLOWO2_02_FULL_44_11]